VIRASSIALDRNDFETFRTAHVQDGDALSLGSNHATPEKAVCIPAP
jgi:hypothetical protein